MRLRRSSARWLQIDCDGATQRRPTAVETVCTDTIERGTAERSIRAKRERGKRKGRQRHPRLGDGVRPWSGESDRVSSLPDLRTPIAPETGYSGRPGPEKIHDKCLMWRRVILSTPNGIRRKWIEGIRPKKDLNSCPSTMSNGCVTLGLRNRSLGGQMRISRTFARMLLDIPVRTSDSIDRH